ncbi:uncharacterized protein ANIA_11530 [Aspergillus nidulans FGSC A4]|uniref:Uncharacterized protein n=1 Tax=Emericella nidulans (strain FGSC A4 / ATCC 38163 / CBS 112.46 / NRRL 194 / M139) TaxID=227321 RepID=C8V2E4_EMENI|nr:hypothetical protein [Aspergillus nidulans FGSC A4]CBF71495.1 TPA: hypothetical protein ANIA_11530 [Aspergillus nidulans FGSC A4]
MAQPAGIEKLHRRISPQHHWRYIERTVSTPVGPAIFTAYVGPGKGRIKAPEPELMLWWFDE